MQKEHVSAGRVGSARRSFLAAFLVPLSLLASAQPAYADALGADDCSDALERLSREYRNGRNEIESAASAASDLARCRDDESDCRNARGHLAGELSSAMSSVEAATLKARSMELSCAPFLRRRRPQRAVQTPVVECGAIWRSRKGASDDAAYFGCVSAGRMSIDDCKACIYGR